MIQYLFDDLWLLDVSDDLQWAATGALLNIDPEYAFEMMRKTVGTALDPVCHEALCNAVAHVPDSILGD